MKIGVQAWGSEGDIRPLLALAGGLAQRGHQVELVYTDFENRHFDDVARALGVDARAVATPVVADPEELTRIGMRMAAASNPLLQGKIITDELFTPVSAQLYEAASDLCDRSDIVVGHFFVYQLQAAAELRRRPIASVMLAHNLVPSRYLHPQGLPRLGEWGNILGWRLARFALNLMMRSDINRFRASVGVAPVADVMSDAWVSHQLNLIAVSPTLCPRPRDWAPHHRVCGFLPLPANSRETVPSDVETFLAEGPAPVFMGFGSLMPRDPELLSTTMSVLVEAARRAECRAIIQLPAAADWPEGRDGHMLAIRRVSHAALFPRCSAIVHHGGAGTTHTALRAGRPSILVPHVADQFFWADALRRAGVAPAAIPRRSLTAWRLASRVRTIARDPSFRERAQALAATMANEDGVATAAALIEGLPR